MPKHVQPMSAIRPVAVRGGLAGRITSEFREMRGLALTAGQTARLMGISIESSSRILGRLVRLGFLQLSPDGRYRIRSHAA